MRREKRDKKMKSLLSTLLIVIFVLTPVLLYAQTDQKPMVRPPISQPLVREGTFAINLANELKVGTPATEAEAENMLTTVGIAPRNGWIADYPITPDIVVELQTSINKAADAGKLGMGKDEALKSLQDVVAGSGLSVTADTSGRGAPETPGTNYPDSAVINNYYQEQGPPVVTYYAPPPDYSYLYSWVPNPFWWWGWWFPGFFILSDFAIFVDFDGHHHNDNDHHNGHHHGEFVSNHFHDSKTGATSRIDPANRSHGGTFPHGSSRWSTPSGQRGAQAIFNGSRSLTRGDGNRSFVSRSGSGRFGSSASGNRTLVSPSGSRSTMAGAQVGRTNVSPRSYTRYYSGASFSQAAYRSYRGLAPSSMASRSFGSTPGGGRAFNSFGAGRGSSGAGSRVSLSGSRGSFGGGARR
jgi:hypothetical protein